IEGSQQDYGSLVITKRLVIIGPGYFTAENPCTPMSLDAVVNDFSLEPTVTADPFTGAAGTEIRGLSFNSNSTSRIDISVSNVIIAQCRIRTEVYFPDNLTSGTQVMQCYFDGDGLGSTSTNTGLNVTFVNNIVDNSFNIVDNSSGVIRHNLFLGNSFNVEVFNGEIRSNIATSTNSFTISTTGAGTLSHNTGGAGQFGTADGNNTAAANTLFITSNSTDGQYQLLASAILVKDNAHDGTDRGPFGGSLPYVLSGVPNIPFIKDLETNAPNYPSIPLNVFIQAQSGN
ncbi:MAG: hypothetical protein AAFN10_11500, partial [Bacteroidota bacterium]